jgi:DNA-binding NtrC family response regulator
LRERPEDIGPLALHFVGKAAARFERDVPPLSEEAVCQLEAYRWPGNVRQLRQIVDRLVLTCPRSDTIDGQAVGAALRNETGTAPASGFADILAAGGSLEEGKREFERHAIEHALRLSGGVVAEAARRLKVERTTLTRRCQRLGIRARRQD